MRILVYLCYRGYGIKGSFSSLTKTSPSKNYLQDVLEKAILKFCPSRRPKILLSTYTECNVHSLSNAATVDFELPGKQKLGTGDLDIHWFKFNINRYLVESNRTLRVIDARFVHETFDPKHTATQRTYLYRFITDSPTNVIEHPLTTYLSTPVSLPLLRSALALIHNRSIDYAGYTSAEAKRLLKDTHRIVGVDLAEFPSLFSHIRNPSQPVTSFSLQFSCTNFLHQMTRRLSTDLIRVGQGLLSLKDFEEKLRMNSTNEPYHHSEQLLDNNGLYLQNVFYDERDFQRYVTYTTLTSKRNSLDPFAPVFTGEE